MADIESDLQIDGKSIYTLRVVDLKQELKKRDIVFKTNATKAQLQTLLVEHLSQSIDTIEEKSIEENEDNSQTAIHSDDTNETPESINETNNVQSVEDLKVNKEDLNEEQTEATDLTSSVSFGANSIKLTIKLQPNETNKQMSPKKSPTKEMRSPVIRDTTIGEDIESNKEEPVVEDLTQKEDSIKEIPKDLTEEKPVEEVSQQKSDSEEAPKDSIVEEVTEQTSEAKDLSKDKEDSSVKDLSSSESMDLSQTSEVPVIIEKQELSSETQDLTKSSTENITSSEPSEEVMEQTMESNVENSEKESQISTKTLTKEETKEATNDEPITQGSDEKSEKLVEKEEKENKSLESEPKPEKAKPPRRRRWGGSVSNETQQNTLKGISSDQLKELIPDLDSSSTASTVPASGANNLSTTSKVSKSDANSIVVTSLSRTQTTVAPNEVPTKRDIRVVRKSVSVPEEVQTSKGETIPDEPVKPSQVSVEQKNKIIVEIENKSEDRLQQQEVEREVSPPKKTSTNIVFIRNLVRPFTLLQLKDVLGRTGTLLEDQFWIDKIKSKCFASYETIDEAIATRQALHGTRWPTSNPKLLDVDFATKEELDSHLNAGIGLNKDSVKKSDENVVNEKYDIVIRGEDQKNNLREKENKIESRPIREWDRDKLVRKEEDNRRIAAKKRLGSPTERRSQEKDFKRRRQDSTKGEERVRPADSTSGEVPAVEATHETESPAKLLDDLFKKTTATPSIYWLPLTEEQVVARDALRAEEEKKRLEERNVREEQFRKRQEDRRPFDAPNQFRNERNQWRTDSPINRRPFGRRGSPPQRRSPPVRRSPRRRSPPTRYSRSPVNRRKR